MQTANFDSLLNADAVEVRGEVAAVACYQLVENEDDAQNAGGGEKLEQSRDGCVWFLDTKDLAVRSQWADEAPGVLDLRWYGGDSLVLACADGEIRVVKSTEGEERFSLEHRMQVDPSILLSIDVAEERSEALVSCSSGSIAVADLVAFETTWKAPKAHSYEAWIAAFETRSPGFIYSGSDDGSLLGWDRRCPAESGPAVSNRRAHEHNGVISILPDPLDAHSILAGGYDDNVRTFDIRNMSEQANSPLKLEGGPWRLKPHPTDARYLLVPAMYFGAYILFREGASAPLSISTEYKGHSSITYGGAWTQHSPDVQRVITCSFYDHSVQSWVSTAQ